MTGRIVPFRSSEKRRRLAVEQSIRVALEWLAAGLAGDVPLADAVFEADHALRPAVREACRAEIA